VNIRVRTEELMPCMYSACMKRLVNWECSARQKYPNTLIYGSKVDFKSAYRRCHLSAATAVQLCTQLSFPNDNGLLIMYLQSTFGGAPGPNECSILEEPICDLATVLIQDKDWDPMVIKSSSQSLVPKPKFESYEPFGIGNNLIVNIPVNPRGTHDFYLDDIIALTVNVQGSSNLERCAGAALLAIEATAQPSHTNKPIPREKWNR